MIWHCIIAQGVNAKNSRFNDFCSKLFKKQDYGNQKD